MRAAQQHAGFCCVHGDLRAAGSVARHVSAIPGLASSLCCCRTGLHSCAVAGLPRLSQADVLVAARGGGGLLKERMALARSLWDAGISAEMLPQVGWLRQCGAWGGFLVAAAAVPQEQQLVA